MFKWTWIILLLLICHSTFSQKKNAKFNFGVQIGIGYELLKCNSVIDSVKIESQTGGLSYAYLNFFAEKKINSIISIRAESSYHFDTSSGYRVYHLKPGKFGIFGEGVTISSPAIHIPLYMVFHLPNLIHKFGFLIGIDNQFQMRVGDYDHYQKFLRPEAIDVMNNLQYTTKFYVPYFLYGLKIDINKRFVFTAKWEFNINKSYTKDLVHYGKSYSFESRRSYIFYTIGYKFYSFKIKKKKRGGAQILKER